MGNIKEAEIQWWISEENSSGHQTLAFHVLKDLKGTFSWLPEFIQSTTQIIQTCMGMISLALLPKKNIRRWRLVKLTISPLPLWCISGLQLIFVLSLLHYPLKSLSPWADLVKLGKLFLPKHRTGLLLPSLPSRALAKNPAKAPLVSIIQDLTKFLICYLWRISPWPAFSRSPLAALARISLPLISPVSNFPSIDPPYSLLWLYIPSCLCYIWSFN